MEKTPDFKQILSKAQNDLRLLEISEQNIKLITVMLSVVYCRGVIDGESGNSKYIDQIKEKIDLESN